jgi:hypothetical protein
MKFLKDSLTGLDGESFNGSKVAGFAVVAAFIGLAIADFAINRKFDPTAFGTGAGLAIAAMGAAVKLTESTEPKP